MLTGAESPVVGQFTGLRDVAAGLARAATTDDVARAALSCATRIAGVVRAGIAISHGAGRELRFVASDGDALGAGGVRWCQIDSLANVPLTQTVRDGEPVFLRSLDELAERYPHMVERQRSLGTQSMATLPVETDDHRYGGLLLSFGDDHMFDPAYQAFLGTFAALVGDALHRTTGQRRRQSTPQELQQALMPPALPDVDGLTLGAHYHPGGLGSEVGGDWYDVLPRADGAVVVSVGDVMGEGTTAAVVMGQVRAALRAYALLDASPAVVLERLDTLVRSLPELPPERIVTLVCGVVAADRRTMTFSVAGHPAPLLLPHVGSPTVLNANRAPPLGLDAGPWPQQTVELPLDATVLLYSNGLVQSRSVDLANGMARLCDDLAETDSRRRRPRAVCARLGELSWQRAAEDDVTLLALGRSGSGAVETATVDLPADASACPLARRFVMGRLRAWGVDEDVAQTAQLCVSELVTNAVIHAGTPSQVTVRLDDRTALVSVRDHGTPTGVQTPGDAGELGSTGRGITIVDALAASWGAERGPVGTTVWFELEAARALDTSSRA